MADASAIAEGIADEALLAALMDAHGARLLGDDPRKNAIREELARLSAELAATAEDSIKDPDAKDALGRFVRQKLVIDQMPPGWHGGENTKQLESYVKAIKAFLADQNLDFANEIPVYVKDASPKGG